MNLTQFINSEKSNSPYYVLFGHPIDHSWSPLMHNLALDHYGLDARYHAIDLQSNELSRLAPFLNSESFLGANVTIPYKQVIADYLDEVDGTARTIGAINTIVKADYQLQGHNTDHLGFAAPLADFEFALEGEAGVVFGTGGAARAVVTALTNIGMQQIYLVSRNPDRITSFEKFRRVEVISYHNWTSFAENSTIIVNATPLGMYPKIDDSPVRDTEIPWLENRICYDIVYNPITTRFLEQAKKAGAETTIGGLEMLIQQASESFRLWTGRSFPTKLIRNQLHEELAD
ncbi:MAG: shikimate dehydrogenase [Fodinibius sp.]|nr:shikimate dehydrogenase [Fodinibius sp.]